MRKVTHTHTHTHTHPPFVPGGAPHSQQIVAHACLCLCFPGNGDEAWTSLNVMRANGVWLCLFKSFAFALTFLPHHSWIFFCLILSRSSMSIPPISLSQSDIIWVLLLCTNPPKAIFCCHVTAFSLPSLSLMLITPPPSMYSFACLPSHYLSYT